MDMVWTSVVGVPISGLLVLDVFFACLYRAFADEREALSSSGFLSADVG